ncbi:MAG: YicC family protein [Nitrospirae bacterium]|nr:YicC family protein [Nitrospirota bacterium]
MPVSMTGFGRHQSREGSYRFEWSIRGVNHRFLDVSMRLPDGLEDLEQDILERIKPHCRRGRVDVILRLVTLPAAPNVNIDAKLARTYRDRIRQTARALGLKPDVGLAQILSLPGVIRSVSANHAGPESLKPALLRGFDKALRGFLAMRRREGDTLERDFLARLRKMRADLRAIEAGLEQDRSQRAAKLKARLHAIAGEEIDTKRFQSELAFILERSDVAEEITRLGSHMEQFENLLKREADAGRKLDFLLQEMQREISTLVAKCETPEWTRVALDLKGTTEQMRQQVQNIE